MKTFFAFLAFLACVITVLAVPTDMGNSAQTSLDNKVIVDLTVHDDRFPGVAFTGTIDSVLEQMKALKPEEFVDDIDDVEPSQAHSLATSKAPVNCEWGVDPFGPESCNANRNHLYKLGRANCCVNGGKDKCARLGCAYTCGSFLCNKTDRQYCAACVDVGHDLNYIMDVCPRASWNVASGAVDFDDHYVAQTKTGGC